MSGCWTCVSRGMDPGQSGYASHPLSLPSRTSKSSPYLPGVRADEPVANFTANQWVILNVGAVGSIPRALQAEILAQINLFHILVVQDLRR